MNTEKKYKNCKNCKKTKLEVEFARHLNSSLRPICLDCWISHTPIYKILDFYEKKEQRRIRENEYDRKNIKITIWKSAKYRAKKYNLPFDITPNDIIIPKYCPVLGIEIKQNIGKCADNSPSLDKIIPKNGYVKTNIKVISWKANSIKRDSSVEELEKTIKYIKESLEEMKNININNNKESGVGYL